MATPYNPTRLLQLLEICSWKSKSTLTYSGFSTLSSNIIDGIIKNPRDPQLPDVKQKYLNDLLIDINSAIEKGENVGRNAEFITSILNYINFKNWESFQEKVGTIESFIDFNKIDFSNFDETKISILAKANCLDEVKTALNYPGKTSTIPLKFEELNQDTANSILNQLKTTLTQQPFIIWCIDDDANNILKADEFKNELAALFELGQIIPVRIGATLSQDQLRTSFVNNKHDIAGEHGLLMALSTILKSTIELNKNYNSKGIKPGGKTHIETLNNNGGNVFLGDIKGESINFGNLTQNFYNKNGKDGNDN